MGTPTEQESNRDEAGRFLPGHSGNPGGRPKRKIVTERIVDQLEKVNPTDPEGRTNLQIIVDSLITQANKGDLGSIKEVIDRAEGKATTSVELSGGVDINGNAKHILNAKIAALSKRGKPKEGTPESD